MEKNTVRKIRRFNIATHRDPGHFFSSLIIVYCFSGIALNHINDWHPNFIILIQPVKIAGNYSTRQLNTGLINSFGKLVGEDNIKYTMRQPVTRQKYYENASLHVNFSTGSALYDRAMRRPIF